MFGLGSLLFNPTPGLKFIASDLIRNLLLSPFMNRQFDEQEMIYEQLWLKKIELRLGGSNFMDAFIDDFLKSKGFDNSSDSTSPVK